MINNENYKVIDVNCQLSNLQMQKRQQIYTFEYRKSQPTTM
jgi:hypothetical protein